ncbi:MAG: hypothetical protein ACLGPL_07370 [Acidobacteriota bacterium]
MADLLSCLKKRDLLNRPVASVETLMEWGRRYEAEGMVNDAVFFYEKAEAREDLERLGNAAVEEGDAFLINRIARILGHEVPREQWLTTAKRAEESGKLAFAAEAYRRGGDEEAAERLSAQAV